MYKSIKMRTFVIQLIMRMLIFTLFFLQNNGYE
jgi:hypothetical protein